MMGNDFELFSGGELYNANIVGLNLNIPILSSGMRLTKVQQARMELDKVQNSKQQLSESLFLQVNKARAEFENAFDSYTVEKENKILTKKIFDNYQTKYQNGMATSLELTQSQLQYLRTEDGYFQSIFNLLDAKNKLDKALGLQ
jgi:outer membrane protein TolC